MIGIASPALASLVMLLVAGGLGLWVASLGMLIGIVARGDDQVTLFSLIAMFVFSALGVTWFPLEGTGSAFAVLGRLMPPAWAMTGFHRDRRAAIAAASRGGASGKITRAWLKFGVIRLSTPE